MDLQCYIATTAEEMRTLSKLPTHPAWMACHFSPYGTGIINLPRGLPQDSMVILNDRIPPSGHNKSLIADQLNSIQCSCYLLDFQVPGIRETEEIAVFLTERLEKPVAISEAYQHCSKGPMLLNLFPHQSLSTSIKTLGNRDIWLEVTTDTESLTVSKTDCNWDYLPASDTALFRHTSIRLHSQYEFRIHDDCAKFLLKRDIPQIRSLLKEADRLHIKKAVGLYQQLQFALENVSTDG